MIQVFQVVYGIEISYLLGVSSSESRFFVFGNIWSLLMEINHKHSQVVSHKDYPFQYYPVRTEEGNVQKVSACSVSSKVNENFPVLLTDLGSAWFTSGPGFWPCFVLLETHRLCGGLMATSSVELERSCYYCYQCCGGYGTYANRFVSTKKFIIKEKNAESETPRSRFLVNSMNQSND